MFVPPHLADNNNSELMRCHATPNDAGNDNREGGSTPTTAHDLPATMTDQRQKQPPTNEGDRPQMKTYKDEPQPPSTTAHE